MKENAAEEAGQGVFSWLQCFGTCVSVLGPVYPNAVPRMHFNVAKTIRA